MSDNLGNKIRVILDHLNTEIRYDLSLLPRPFFVEITGPPSSGKTTTITELDSRFRRHGFRVLCPQEGAQVIRHVSRKTPLYNIRTGLYALQILLDLSHGHNYDIVIFDRSIFDAYVWMEYWHQKGKLSDEEAKLWQNAFLFRLHAQMIDAAYFMICDLEEIMRRYSRLAPNDKEGNTTNRDTVSRLREGYIQAQKTLQSKHPQLNLIDTSKMDERSMVDDMEKRILDAFEKEIQIISHP